MVDHCRHHLCGAVVGHAEEAADRGHRSVEAVDHSGEAADRGLRSVEAVDHSGEVVDHDHRSVEDVGHSGEAGVVVEVLIRHCQNEGEGEVPDHPEAEKLGLVPLARDVGVGRVDEGAGGEDGLAHVEEVEGKHHDHFHYQNQMGGDGEVEEVVADKMKDSPAAREQHEIEIKSEI